MLRRGMMAGGGGTGIWSPTDKSSGITLSSGNSIATRTGGANTYVGLRGAVPITMPSYWEISVDWGMYGGGRAGIGLARASMALDTDSDYIGGTVDSASIWGPRNDTYYGGPYSDYANSIGASVYCFALQPSTGKLWIRELVVLSGAWFGGGDPSAGTSPTLVIGSTTDYFPAIHILSGVADGFMLNAGEQAFVGGVPSGFAAGIA